MITSRKIISCAVSFLLASSLFGVVPSAYADGDTLQDGADASTGAEGATEAPGTSEELVPPSETDDAAGAIGEDVSQGEPSSSDDEQATTGGDLEDRDAAVLDQPVVETQAEAYATAAAPSVELAANPDIRARAHVQNVGWQSWQAVKVNDRNGIQLGVSGKSLRMEALALSVKSAGKLKTTSVDASGNTQVSERALKGTVVMRAHVQNVGWQGPVNATAADNVFAGTQGRALRIEAIQLSLTEELAQYFDIFYRVHAQNIGWMDWAKNGESAGTEGCALRLEAIQVLLIPKDGGVAAPTPTAKHFLVSNSIAANAHVQNVGWQGKRWGNVGTSGRGLRMEAVRIDAPVGTGMGGGIEYAAHVQNVGWQGWVQAGQMAGTEGRSLRVEAFRIRLTGEISKYYDVYYRCHVQNLGWLGWAKNGQDAGSAGLALRMEALQIRLVPKGMQAPGSTAGCYFTSITGNAGVDAWTISKARSLGSLRACYNWTVNHTHTNWAGPNARYANGTTYWIASEAARMRDGRPTDCYAYAAAFTCLARALGYDAKAVCGWVPSRSRGRAPHSWVEIRRGGTTYVYDPGLQHNVAGRNFYGVTYATAPTRYSF